MEWVWIISLCGVICAFYFGWSTKSRTVKQDIVKEANTDGALQMDVTYIKRGIDDIRVDLRMQGQRVDGLSERVTRMEESSKQAHKRLDRLEE